MIRILSLFFCFFIAFEPVSAFQQADTLKGSLDDIVVVGYEGNRSLQDTPGAVSLIKTVKINEMDESSLVYSMNSVPGIRFEKRAPGSYRVAIRGSSLRSPFGVRNVKIYWNGLPLTEPTGSTPLNLLDVMNMQQIEIIRGPAGAVYGAGNGGALIMNSRKPENRLETGFNVGAFGYRKYTFNLQKSLDNGYLKLAYANQNSDSYRDQAFFNRQTLELSASNIISDKWVLIGSLLLSDLNYGIPGGLTLEQYLEDPTQARQGNAFVLGSVEANASIDQKALIGGFTADLKINEHWKGETTLFTNISDFENPFNFDYKIDDRRSGGIRSRWQWDPDLFSFPFRLIGGGEYQYARYDARNFENNSGEPGALNFDDDLFIQTGLIFMKAEADLNSNWFLTAGLSINDLEYVIDRQETNEEGDRVGKSTKKFRTEVVPRVALSKRINTALTVYGNISYGFSPPTIEEVRTNEGSINIGLEAERGANYELGWRGFVSDMKLNYDISAFYFSLDETIVQRQSDRGTTLFQNAGATDQYGAEFQLQGRLLNERIRWDLAYTYHFFEFKEYRTDGNDFSGNRLTGVAPHTFNGSIRYDDPSGWYLLFSHNFTDEIPLNDANTVYADSYHLMQAKTGWKFDITDSIDANLFVGIDNLLDERYSLGNDLNAFGERYYQPAAERNVFGGFRFSVDI